MESENDFSRSSRPFAHIVMCCTGTSISGDARAELSKQVVEMGAVWKQDLTSEATHMLVGESSTKKYKYVAKQRPDVKVVTIDFVEAARRLWLNGEDIVLEVLEQQHKLPTFHEFKICVTNLQEDDRNRIQILTEQHGGTFHGDLTKSITHLIVAQTEGKKYQFAKNWNIKCVSPEWFYESIERGMTLEEAYYDPETPADQRGKGAWIRPNLGKRKSSNNEGSNAQPVVRRRIRRIASDRLGHQSQNLWGDIIGQAQAPKPVDRNEWDEPQAIARLKSTIILEESGLEETSHISRSKSGPANGPRRDKNPSTQEKPSGIFADIGFFIHGFDSKKAVILRGLIQSYNGECYHSLNALVGSPLPRLIIVVPETLRSSELPSTSDLSKAVHIVTYWWIEKCMHVGKFVDPDSHILGKPFRKTGIKEFRDMTISISKFDGVDFLHLHKTIELLGATWYDKLSQKRSLLIVNLPFTGGKSEKVEAALEWGIPVVSVEWLLECVSDGERIPFTRYIVAGSATNNESAKNSASALHEDDRIDNNGQIDKQNADDLRYLEDCVLYFGSTVQDLKVKLEPVIKNLGGVVVDSLKGPSQITHFLHIDKGSGDDPDVIIAKQFSKCHIITPAWLKASHNLKCRANEKEFLSISHNDSKEHETDLAGKQLIGENDVMDISGHSNTNDDTQDFSVGPFLLDDDGHAKTNMSLVSMVEKSVDLPEAEAITTRSNSILQSFEINQKASPDIVIVNKTTTTTVIARPSMQPPTPEAIRTKTLEAIQEVKSFREIISGQTRQSKSRGRLQGRAPSNPNIGNSNNVNSASGTSSVTSALSILDYTFDNDEDDAERKTAKLDETQFGNVEPSQVVVYDDPVAQEERRKLMEALQLKTEDKRMKGRVISASTSAVEEMGDPNQYKRRSTRRTNH